MTEGNENLTVRILQEMRAEIAKRFDGVDARFAHVEAELRGLKAAVNKHTVLHEATIEMVAQLKASRTVTDVSIRQHESELEEIRERLAKLEERR